MLSATFAPPRATTTGSRPVPAPELSELRALYPLTVANFGALAEREAWLRRIWELDIRWQRAMERRGEDAGAEFIMRGAPPSDLTVAGEFAQLLVRDVPVAMRAPDAVRIEDQHAPPVA